MKRVWLWIDHTTKFTHIDVEDDEQLPHEIVVHVRLPAQVATMVDSYQPIDPIPRRAREAVFKVHWPGWLSPANYHYLLATRPPAGWQWLAYNGRLLAEEIP